MLGAWRDVQCLSGLDFYMPVAQTHIAFALEHVHDLFRGRMPMLGINLSGQDVNESEALLATRIQIAISDPFDRSPLVHNWFDIRGFSNGAFQHDLLPQVCGAFLTNAFGLESPWNKNFG
jgi:hypothetical protein